MKWAQFRDVKLANQWLADSRVLQAMDWHFSPDQLREFVRKKVLFIAFRPFEKLDLKAERFNLNEEVDGWINYFLFFHFEGHPERQMRADTLEGMIEAVKHLGQTSEWRYNKIVWDRVVKETLAHGKFALEVYPFPPGFGVPPTPTEKPISTYEKEARSAYLNNRPMPPIRPGEILNAQA